MANLGVRVSSSISQDIQVVDLLNISNKEYLVPTLGPPGYQVLGTQIDQGREGVNHQVEPETNFETKVGFHWAVKHNEVHRATLLQSHTSLGLSVLVLFPSQCSGQAWVSCCCFPDSG